MTREERIEKLRHLITCMKCEVSGKYCDDSCPTQYCAGNMGEIIENLEEIAKALEQEPCEDAISRQAVLAETYNWSKDEFLRVTNPFDYLRKRINSLPSVTSAGKCGRWVKTIGENGVTSAVRCSKCGFEDNRYMLFRYCPNCGAKMEEEE